MTTTTITAAERKRRSALALAVKLVKENDTGWELPEVVYLPEEQLYEWLNERAFVWNGRSWDYEGTAV